MEFRDLKKQYINNKDVIDAAVHSVLEGGQFIGGELIKQLEEMLADYVGVKHCITCANGTDALQLALMAWGIGKGDAVFVPDFTFFATAEVVPWVGAVPVFVDVDKNTFNLSAEALEEAVQRILKEGKLVPKVVIAVDLFGQPADYPEIKKITQKYNMLLLEDGAQGFGGRIGDQKACSFGDIATTSFFPAKPLGCYGDGGAVFTDNDEWAELIWSYKVHGKGIDKYDNVRIGMNSRLDTMQAAVLIEKLGLFRKYELEECNKIADKYSQLLEGIVEVPLVRKNMLSSWAQYTIKLADMDSRKRVIEGLKGKNIPSNVYYVKPLHKQRAFDEYKLYNECFLVTERLCDTVLSLPMHPYLVEDEVKLICDSLKEIL